MKIFFLTPFAVSLGAAGYLMFSSRARQRWRVIGVLIVVVAAALQFLDWFVEPINIHFLIPLLMQVIVSIAVIIHASLDDIAGGW